MNNNNEVPFQVEQLINNLLNKQENVYIRQNYRQRLVSIQEALDKALQLYDNELFMTNSRKNIKTGK